MRRFFLLAALVAALPALAAGQAAPPAQSPAPAPAPAEPAMDWSPAKAAVARIDVQGPGGTPLRQVYGVALGAPARIVTTLTDLAGATTVVATFAQGSGIKITRLAAVDPINNVAVLDTDDSLPSPPEPDQTIRWLAREKIYVIPGPGAGDVGPEQWTSEVFQKDKLRLVPMTGDFPPGMAVMHYCGRWIGITGRIEGPSEIFTYMIPKEAIYPCLFREEAPITVAQAGAMKVPWTAPDDPTGLLVRAVLKSYASPDDALPFFNVALQHGPKIPEVHFWMGKLFFRQQKFSDAEASFLEAAKLRPTWAMAFHMAGAAANQQGKYDIALTHYEDALKIDPNSSMTLNNKAGALRNLGRTQESIEVLQKAVAADSTNSEAVYNLGISYAEQKKSVEAEQLYARLKDLNPDSAKRLRDKIDGKW